MTQQHDHLTLLGFTKKTHPAFAFMTTVKIQDHLPEWGWDFSEKSTVCQLPHKSPWQNLPWKVPPSPCRSTCQATKSEWRIWNQNLPRKNLSEDEKQSKVPEWNRGQHRLTTNKYVKKHTYTHCRRIWASYMYTCVDVFRLGTFGNGQLH